MRCNSFAKSCLQQWTATAVLSFLPGILPSEYAPHCFSCWPHLQALALPIEFILVMTLQIFQPLFLARGKFYKYKTPVNMKFVRKKSSFTFLPSFPAAGVLVNSFTVVSRIKTVYGESASWAVFSQYPRVATGTILEANLSGVTISNSKQYIHPTPFMLDWNQTGHFAAWGTKWYYETWSNVKAVISSHSAEHF